MNKYVKIITEPTIIPIAEMGLIYHGMDEMAEYLQSQGGCGLDEFDRDECDGLDMLVQHDGLREATSEDGSETLTDNEMLCEIAGRKCYNSFGSKIGHGSNEAYLANLMGAPGKIPHGSVFYHAKMTFFFAGISRRMTHELIRHYVGADRTEEGCPSQESTRYTEHPGHFIAHPRHLDDEQTLANYTASMQIAYNSYLGYLQSEVDRYSALHGGAAPKGMDRKRIYEAAAAYLPGNASTSMIWTTNPMALQKVFLERCDDASDLEIQRFAKKWRAICYKRWPNLFRESNPRTK